MLDLLAYVHLAVTYEWQTDTPLFPVSQSHAFFESLQWRSLSSKTRSRWLSVGMTLVALSLVSEAIVASIEGDRVLAQAYPEACPSGFGDRTLRRNDGGADVRVMQEVLHNLGYYYVNNTGLFDTTTEAAVVHFQRSRKLTVDGQVGDRTRQALREACLSRWGISRPFAPENLSGTTGYQPHPTSPPFEVTILQTRLQEAGFYRGSINGIFDNRTRQAVLDFQDEVGLYEDGIVDRLVLAELEDFISRLEPERYAVIVPMRRNPYLLEDTNRIIVRSRNSRNSRHNRERMLMNDINRIIHQYGHRHQAYIDSNRHGEYVDVGLYRRDDAEDLSDSLRELGLDARVVYRRNRT